MTSHVQIVGKKVRGVYYLISPSYMLFMLDRTSFRKQENIGGDYCSGGSDGRGFLWRRSAMLLHKEEQAQRF